MPTMFLGTVWGLLAVGWGWLAGSRYQRGARSMSWISLLIAFGFLADTIFILLNA